MKKHRLGFLILIVGLFLLVWRSYVHNAAPTQIFTIDQRTEIVIEPEEVHPILVALNERNSKIKSFTCDDIDVRIERNGQRFKLDGIMLYEKDRNFRLKISSFFGLELDMGSNSSQFWVWSKRMEPKATMFYANHDDLYKTRLRTPFVPIWIMGALGYRTIDPDQAYYMENDKHLIISRHVVSPTGQPLIKRAYIDKETHLVVAYYLYDLRGTEITVTQIAYENGLPKKLYMRWNEEDVIMDFILHNPRTNVPVNGQEFELPDYRHKIDMGNDSQNCMIMPGIALFCRKED